MLSFEPVKGNSFSQGLQRSWWFLKFAENLFRNSMPVSFKFALLLKSTSILLLCQNIVIYELRIIYEKSCHLFFEIFDLTIAIIILIAKWRLIWKVRTFAVFRLKFLFRSAQLVLVKGFEIWSFFDIEFHNIWK